MPPTISNQSEWFLNKLFGDKGDNQATVWTLPNRVTHFFKDLPKQKQIDLLCKNRNAFFGLGLCAKRLSSRNRPKKDQVSGITCMWADVDYGTEGHKSKTLPPTLDDAIGLVKQMPWLPSIIVHSGHGIHAYWLLDEPWLFEAPEEYLQADELSQRFSCALKDIAGQKNWHVDSVFDIARVLRLPGTLNVKDPDNPVACEIIEHNEFTISRDALDDVLPSLTEAVKEQRKEMAANQKKDGKEKKPKQRASASFKLNSDAQYPSEKFDLLMDNSDELEPLWTRKRRGMKDSTPSGWDMALVCLFVRSGWTDQEIVDALIHHRRKHNDRLKLDRIDYYINTIAKGRQLMKKRVAQEEVDKMAQQVADETRQEEDPKIRRERALTLLSETLGLRIKSIEKFLQDPPIYRLLLLDSQITLGEVDALTSQTKFKNKVAAASGYLISPMSKNRWHTTVQLLLDVCEDIDLGEDATKEGALKSHLREFLRTRTLTTDHNKGCQLKHSFQMHLKKEGECVFVHLSSLMAFIKINQLMNETRNQVAVYLKTLGAIPVSMKYVTAQSKRTTANVWKLPKGEFDEFLLQREDDDDDVARAS